MSKRTDPREVIVATLSGIFLVAFVLLFVWLIFVTWTSKNRLPDVVENETFTHVTTSMVGLVGGIAATWMGQRAGCNRHSGGRSSWCISCWGWPRWRRCC